jgi:hypothetical protein
MTRSASLIQSNSQVYRIYSRRLSNPADPQIFITAARKLTTFLSDERAYYDEAQQPVRPHTCIRIKHPFLLVITLVDLYLLSAFVLDH